jgi:hypothetical protein|tara:strand:- start:101 stop:706 length:606 start_codon:yes stop_codon:yes gene_type:complete
MNGSPHKLLKTKMKIEIVRDEVKSLDIDHLKSLSLNANDWQAAGISEYRLYAYLSTFFNKTTILDIGTRTGGSALALSYNPQNTVRSYDLREQGASSIKKDNISWNIGDFMKDTEIDWDNVSIVMIDVDPHDGAQERVMMDWLRDKGWKGIMLHDDIGPGWPDIQLMWDEIPEEKFDVTDIAHLSGTGLVNFGDAHEINFV